MIKRLISVLVCVLLMIPVLTMFVTASNTNADSTTYYGQIPYKQMKYSYYNNNNTVSYSTNWNIEDNYIGNVDNTSNVTEIFNRSPNQSEYRFVQDLSGESFYLDFRPYVTNGKCYALYFYELDEYAVGITFIDSGPNALNIIYENSSGKNIYTDFVWSNELYRNYKVVTYNTNESVSATASESTFGDMYQSITNHSNAVAQTILGMSWLAEYSDIQASATLSDTLETSFRSEAINSDSIYGRGWSTLTTYDITPSQVSKTRILLSAKNFQITPSDNIEYHYILLDSILTVEVEINYTYFEQVYEQGDDSLQFKLERKSKTIKYNPNYTRDGSSFKYMLFDMENEFIFDMFETMPIINNFYVRITSNTPITKIRVNNVYSTAYRSINNSLSDMIDNVNVNFNPNNEPTQEQKSGLYTWIIKPLDSFLSTELFYGIAIADIMWLCVGVALIMAILKIFAGG